MQLPKRIYQEFIAKDLEKKMVFLGGPRQIGKTTLAQSFLKNYHDGHAGYYNWDNESDRRKLNRSEWSKEEPLVIFDEIHKKKTWQSFVKGAWDTWKNTQRFMVTGSARLDIFRKGGDSMLGRYHYYRIHPFTLPELGINRQNLNLLYQFGGFPEPLLEQNELELKRWHVQRISKLVRIDLRDLENVSDLDKVELLADSLQPRAGSLLSYKSLAEDLEISDKTVRRWIQILSNLYYCYLIPPLGSAKIKAIKKAQKIYLWDWSQVEDPGARFENMVASHLLKLCDFWLDAYGDRAELRFIRDETGKECDFVVLRNRQILFAVECKLSDSQPSASLLHLRSKLKIPMWYQVHLGERAVRLAPDLIVLPFEQFCEQTTLI